MMDMNGSEHTAADKDHVTAAQMRDLLLDALVTKWRSLFIFVIDCSSL
jgi:hypothetical protein